ncbi:MAG: polynucleotide adenylyltransferase PcnB [Myxococcales bacterium]|nr:polynucleotide adenylyltransferase PcnB [Myxococcales bacterium]
MRLISKPTTLPHDRIDKDALSVVADLQRAGHVTYLVGGCVRDLLLGTTPKDFDIATGATPKQIRKLFRNCQIIGRRFKLAHVYFGPKILEVATFRGRGSIALGNNEMDAEEVIERTNLFGTPEQDAKSRDFTVNGLFYDPIARTVIDHVNGQPDLANKQLRTIGDPFVRLQEDPVRILRAIKFCSRLGFTIEAATQRAMREYSRDITLCPPPRVTEEIFRLAESAYAAKAFSAMIQFGVMESVLPEVYAFIRAADRDVPFEKTPYYRFLSGLDRLATINGGVPRDFLLTTLFFPVGIHFSGLKGNPYREWGSVFDEWFRAVGIRMHMPTRLRSRMRAIVDLVQHMLAEPIPSRPGRTRTVLRDSVFPMALCLLRLHVQSYAEGAEAYENWATLALDHGIVASPEPSSITAEHQYKHTGTKKLDQAEEPTADRNATPPKAKKHHRRRTKQRRR